MSYELTDADRALLALVRKAVEYAENGDPIKDAMDPPDIIDALLLLDRLTNQPTAARRCPRCGEAMSLYVLHEPNCTANPTDGAP